MRAAAPPGAAGADDATWMSSQVRWMAWRAEEKNLSLERPDLFTMSVLRARGMNPLAHRRWRRSVRSLACALRRASQLDYQS